MDQSGVWILVELIQDVKDNTDNDFEFSEAQILVIELLGWPLEQAWRKQVKARQSPIATVDTLRKLANDLGSPLVGVIAG